MLDGDKIYDFTIRFGMQTDTLDLEGSEIAACGVRPTIGQIEAVLPRFTGPIAQVPPAYSALKVDGARAYDLARAGEEVILASRPVTIHSLLVRHPGLVPGSTPPIGKPSVVAPWTPEQVPGDEQELVEEITLTAHVSKGTYIRSLARDIAQALGTVGHVTMLRRTKAGPFTLDSAISLDKLADAAKARSLEQLLLPLRAGLDDIPALSLAPDQAGLLRRGQVLAGIAAEDGQYFALLEETPVALVEAQAGFVRVVRGFNL
jgi:tRNA pseudouridine55 synthase